MRVRILHIPTGHITSDTYDSIFAKQIMVYIFLTKDSEYDVPKEYRDPIEHVCKLVADKDIHHWYGSVERVRLYHLKQEFELVYV
jgi:hypothetical protein